MTPTSQPASQVPDSQGQALLLVIRPKTYPTSDPHPQPRSSGWGLIGLRALPTKRRLVDSIAMVCRLGLTLESMVYTHGTSLRLSSATGK